MQVVRRRCWPLPPVVVAILPGLLALGVYLWQLTVPEQVALYDTGVYLAASIHLVSGVLPYRDFVFVQPPGILYLLAPIVLVSRVLGTHDAVTLGRILTSCVTAINCSMVAWLVRGHGRLAMAVSGVALALLPVMLLDSSGIRLEPYCVAFVLAATLILTSPKGAELLSRREVLLAGALVGVAALIKLWAFFPFLALALFLALRARHRLLGFLAGAGAAFLTGVAPMVIAAPRAFVGDVFIAQLGRGPGSEGSVDSLVRLRILSGLWSTSLSPNGAGALVGFGVLVLLVIVACRHWRQVPDADVVVVLLAFFSTVMLFFSTEFYTYYPCFSSPFLIAVVVVAVATTARPIWRRFPPPKLSRASRVLVTWSVAASALLLVVGTVLYVTTFFTNHAWFKGSDDQWVGAIGRVIPAGSCVTYTEVGFGLYANRFTTTDPHCPPVVDVFGESMAQGHGFGVSPTQFSREWESYFRESRYVVLSVPYSTYVPWTHELRAWFAAHYTRIYDHAYVVIYKKTTS